MQESRHSLLTWRPPAELFDHYRAIVHGGVMEVRMAEGDKCGIMIRTEKMAGVLAKYPKVAALLMLAQEQGASSTIELFTTAKVYDEGMKVIRLRQRDCEALENTELNFFIEEYNQPFPTMIVELPPDYMVNKVTHCAQAGLSPMPGTVYPEIHAPQCVVIHHASTPTIKALLVATHFTSGQVITNLFYNHPSRPNITVGQMYDVIMECDRFEGSFVSTESEEQVNRNAVTSALNALMIMDAEGFRKVGPPNPSHYDKLLQKHARFLRRGDQEHALMGLRELNTTPVYYDFGPTVQVYQKERTHGDGEGGSHVIPHWRKGHWRNQRHGPGLTLTRRRRIRSVYVNAHLLRE